MTAALGFLEVALLHGTVVAALVWGLQRLLRAHLTPALACAVWTVALLKFLIPIGPASTVVARPTWCSRAWCSVARAALLQPQRPAGLRH